MTDATTTPAAPRAVCVVCVAEKEVSHSLALKRDKAGSWVSQPVCADCRRGLIAEARAAGKFVPFYSLESSEKEAAKRNGNAMRFRPFLDRFGRDQERRSEPRPKAKARPKLKAVKG